MKKAGVYKRTAERSGAHFHCGFQGSAELTAEQSGSSEASIGSISGGFLEFTCNPGERQMFVLTFLELYLR